MKKTFSISEFVTVNQLLIIDRTYNDDFAYATCVYARYASDWPNKPLHCFQSSCFITYQVSRT